MTAPWSTDPYDRSTRERLVRAHDSVVGSGQTVPGVRRVVAESWELVDDGLLTADQYRQFVFENPVALFGADFFRGTAVEQAARRLKNSEAASSLRDQTSI